MLVSVATAQPVVVAALGDSLTAGYGLPQEEGFVPVLEDWLEGQGAEVELRNAGVSGDTTAGGLSRIDWTLTDDVDALIVGLGGNDMLRGVDPATSRENLDGILAAAQQRGLPVLLMGLTGSGNFGPEYKAAFDAMYPELAAQYNAVLYPDFFAALTTLEDQAAARRDHMQGDGIHPSASGVQLIVEDIGPSVLELLERVE